MGMMSFDYIDTDMMNGGVWFKIDGYRGENGGYREERNGRMADPVIRLLNESADPASISAGKDDIPVPVISERIGVEGAGEKRTIHVSHIDYMVDAMGLDPGAPVLMPVNCYEGPYGFQSAPGPDWVDGHGLCMNPIFMYHDFITLTAYPEKAIKAMGFHRAMRLSALSRAKHGGMRTLGVTRRRLFSMALEHADDGTLDRFLATAAAAHDHGLKRMMREYSGLPDGFVIETMHMKAAENADKPWIRA